MDPATISRIAQDAGLPESSVSAAVALFEDGATLAFVARYRREAAGGLDEAQLRSIQEFAAHYKELQSRRAVILKSIAEQGKLTDDLRLRIEACFVRAELEDLFLPFRLKRKSRSAEWAGKGIEPLAEYLWNQETDAWSPEEHIDVFIDPEKGIASREEALKGACEIMVDWISENGEARKALREMMWNDGFMVSKVVPARSEQKTKYNMYYDRKEAISSIPCHRVLAIRRGIKEGILTSFIESDDEKAINYLFDTVIRDRVSAFAPVLEAAVRDSYARLIRPGVESDVRAQLKERADRDAIRVFQDNLAHLLLSPPAGFIVTMGIDPGKGAERKLAVVDETGKFLEESSISAEADIEVTRATLKEMIAKHNVRAVAVANGTGSRDTELTVRQTLEEKEFDSVFTAGINDAGITVYSTSRLAREEFPELEAGVRSAISIARRLQDPLAELVKVDPKLIGVGQYQHDVDQKELHRGLVVTVQSCVNHVGVNLNSADVSLLRYVAGINDGLARRIVAHRNANGSFASRASLLEVPGMSEKAFQQAAGFVRVEGENVLDKTSIHPESYPIVEKMAAAAGVPISELIENKTLLSSLNLEEFVTDSATLPALNNIREELIKPARDPRKAFTVPKFRADVKQIDDLKEGMSLEGTVTNVTNFGAFVDIGVRQDGLVHLSQMSNRFIRDPRSAVQVGDVVKVKVISVEAETKRIGLSMKALLPPLRRRRKRSPRRGARPQPASPVPGETGAEISVAADSGSAPDGAVPEASSPAPAARRADGRPRHGPRRRRRDRSRPPELDRADTVAPEEAKLPEPTFQEKIAALQSKFRGIS
jgi:protein Tex